MFITKKNTFPVERSCVAPASRWLCRSSTRCFLPLRRGVKAQGATKVPRFVGPLQPAWLGAGTLGHARRSLGELPFILKPLEAYKDSITVISGLDATSSMPATGENGRRPLAQRGRVQRRATEEDRELPTFIWASPSIRSLRRNTVRRPRCRRFNWAARIRVRSPRARGVTAARM